MFELNRVPQTASMNDIKNKTVAVLKKFKQGPVLLMNRATPQAVLVSPEQWNEIIDHIDDLRDVVATLQAELEIATGDSQLETITDPDAFATEIMAEHDVVSA